MAAHMARAVAVRHNMASMGLSAVPPRLGTRRTARRVAECTGANTLALKDLVSVPLTDFAASPLRTELAGCPGMADRTGSAQAQGPFLATPDAHRSCGSAWGRTRATPTP